ncbi:BRCA1-associated RING domain protein 1-like isoform X3 [Ananas comosus]|uniref:BRCA1-associated RING domain protein 1-like isoform X3 n=1 Tax=Ananas comosus TaxID=4615 RepID=A0A6P5G5U1_ANACO|nr:BRCA1-associated RING domain protein 1-like isoform X3 [Ananas comosus]
MRGIGSNFEPVFPPSTEDGDRAQMLHLLKLAKNTNIATLQSLVLWMEQSAKCPACNCTFLDKDVRHSVHMGAMVNIFRDMDSSIADICQERRSHNSEPTRQRDSSATIPGLMEGNNLSSAKVEFEKIETHTTRETTLPSCKDLSTSESQLSDRQNSMLKKRCQTKEVVKGPKRTKQEKVKNFQCGQVNKQPLCTPTKLYVDECVFCHTFRTTEASGPMLCYVNGELVAAEEANHSNVMHVHQKCFDWSPQIYFSGDTVINFEVELARASQIKCSKCGLNGAALGCYYKSCRKSFHVPCAIDIPDCRWDCKNFHVLCPSHSSKKLPCDEDSMKMVENNCSSSTQMNPSNEEGQRSGQVSELKLNRPNEWILLGSALTQSEKDLLSKFAILTGATMVKNWRQNVTHVITSTDGRVACRRSHKVLMAILHGKWVVRMTWVEACMESGHPVSEEPFEVAFDLHGSFDGPKKGRIRAMEKAPKLFAGLSFCLSDYIVPLYKVCLEDLGVAAGGKILGVINLLASGSTANGSSPELYFVYNEDPPNECSTGNLIKVKEERVKEAADLAKITGAQVIGHIKFLNAIASLDARFLTEEKCQASDILVVDIEDD